jgi:MoxR-like ATPase
MTTPVTSTVAPPVGSDPEFDAVWGQAWSAVTAAGNPEGLDPEAAREKLAQVMAKHAGKVFVGVDLSQGRDRTVAANIGARTLVIPRPSGEPLWWDDPKHAEFTDHFILTRRALGAMMPGGLLITGPSGAGKTEGAAHAVERVNEAHGLALRLFRMDCATVTDPQKWFGRREVDAAGTRYEKSDFILAVERGDVVLLDELTRLHPSIHNGVMSLLDGSNSVHLSDLNVTVERHPETVFIATANIGVQYGGTHRLDAAMRERFPYSIERGFPPADIEPAILASRSGCDLDGAVNLVKVATESRKLHANGDLRTPVSTRTLVYAALLVAAGMTEKEALEFTATPMYDPDANGIAGAESERAKFRAIVKGKLS